MQSKKKINLLKVDQQKAAELKRKNNNDIAPIMRNNLMEVEGPESNRGGNEQGPSIDFKTFL